MNRWATDGGDPFTDARWEDAWKISRVDAKEWQEIRDGLHDESDRWITALGTIESTANPGLAGMIGSIVHLAYHVGAIRQIARNARGPKEGTFD
jgi:hypothetical protein